MPSMANITVKDSDGTTDVVFNALTPSSGDTTSAVWRAEALGSGVAANRPKFEMKSRSNEPRTARRLDLILTVPDFFTDSSTSTTKVSATITATVSVAVPTSVPDTRIASAMAYLGNLLDSSLIQDALKAGYAPT